MQRKTIIVISLMAFVVFLPAMETQADPPKVKKLKPQKLEIEDCEGFFTVLDVFAITGSRAGANTACLPFGFGVFFKTKNKVDDTVRVETHVSVYGADGSFLTRRPALTDLPNGILNARVVQHPDGYWGFFYAVQSDTGALQYWFQRADSSGNFIGAPVLLREIEHPQSVGPNGNVTVRGANLLAVAGQFGFMAAGSAVYYEHGNNYNGVNSSQVNVFSIAANNGDKVGVDSVSLPNKGKYQDVQLRDLTGDSNDIIACYESTRYQKSEMSNYAVTAANNAGVFPLGPKIDFSPYPPTKIKPVNIADSQSATATAFPTMQYLPPEAGGEAGSVFYQYRQPNTGPDSDIRLYSEKYYIQPLDQSNKPKGQPQEVAGPQWNINIKENPLRYFYRYENHISDMVPLGGGKYLGLQARSMAVKLAAPPEFDFPVPAAKLQGTAMEVNVVLLDAGKKELSIVAAMKIKGKERDYVCNPLAVLSGDSVAFYFEQNNSENWSVQGYVLIEPLASFTN